MPDANAIQAKKPYAIKPSLARRRVPYRGPLRGEVVNQLHEQIENDILALAQQGNVHAAAIVNYAHTLQRETDGARLLVQATREQLAYQQKVEALQGKRVGLWYDLHDGSEISFLPGSSIAKRASISTQFGEATVPMNAAEPRTYSLAIVGSSGVSPLNAIATVSGDFDDGDGVENHEGGAEATIEQTDPLNVANGNNGEYWRRRVILPLDSDIAEVECELTLQLPDQSTIRSNLLYLHPYPIGFVDVTGLWVSSDLSDSFSLVENFEAVDGSGKRRWFIPAQDIAKVKVRLRQRNWVEENGKKVFEYGLQELGVQLVEWDKTYDAAASQLTDNHAFVIRYTPPRGMLFSQLYGFHSDPMFTLEPSGSRHLHFVLAHDEAGTSVIWSSDSMATPQSLETPLDLGASEELFLIVTMNWVAEASGGSPFLEGCPPFMRGAGLNVTLAEAV